MSTCKAVSNFNASVVYMIRELCDADLLSV